MFSYIKILASFLLLALMVPVPSYADSSINLELSRQASEILKEWSTIKPGTTRLELLKLFTPEEGGISNSTQRRFIYKHCPYIKVDVEFILANPNQRVELPTDTVKAISKPYLEYAIAD
jgi:hypothetical protein